jgi:hypothetical protein
MGQSLFTTGKKRHLLIFLPVGPWSHHCVAPPQGLLWGCAGPVCEVRAHTWVLCTCIFMEVQVHKMLRKQHREETLCGHFDYFFPFFKYSSVFYSPNTSRFCFPSFFLTVNNLRL